MVPSKPDRGVEMDELVPRYFYVIHTFVTLIDNMMFANEIAFLTTLSRRIRAFT